MTYEKAKRIQWHLSIPFCRTLRNIRLHINLMAFDDLQAMLSFFNCELAHLPKRFYRAVTKGCSVV